MKVLGLDSSGLVAGVALIQDDVLIAEYTTDYKKTHSQTLLPALRRRRGSDLHWIFRWQQYRRWMPSLITCTAVNS